VYGRFKDHLTAELGQIRDRGLDKRSAAHSADRIAFALDKSGKEGKRLGAIP
jgi:hypothetical protein